MGASLVAQRLKRLPAMQETWVRSLDQDDPLEKEMAPHFGTLSCKIPWTEKPGVPVTTWFTAWAVGRSGPPSGSHPTSKRSQLSSRKLSFLGVILTL